LNWYAVAEVVMEGQNQCTRT